MFKKLKLFFEELSLVCTANGYVQQGLITTRTCEALLKAYGVTGL